MKILGGILLGISFVTPDSSIVFALTPGRTCCWYAYTFSLFDCADKITGINKSDIAIMFFIVDSFNQRCFHANHYAQSKVKSDDRPRTTPPDRMNKSIK